MISYREDNFDHLVDEWLGPNSTSKDINAHLPSVDLPKANQRQGLGFQSNKHTESKSLSKKEKKRGRQGNEDEYVGDLHGVVEEDVEDSKLSAISKKPDQKKPKPAANKPSSSSDKAAVVEQTKTESKSELPKKSVPPSNTKTAPLVQSQNLSSKPLPEPANTEKPHKKRTKTRSKQKNIRRDTRPLDQRPEYLRPDNEFFAGRVMTEQTKQKLSAIK